MPRSLSCVDTAVLEHQMPKGLYSTMYEELCDFYGKDILRRALDEVTRVRAEAGYAPLVTPIAQIIGTQALYNVLDKERYTRVTDEFKLLLSGAFGRTPAPIDPDLIRTLLGENAELISARPAELIPPEMEDFRAAVAPYAEQEEDLLTLALFDKTALKFFEARKNQRYRLDRRASRRSGTHPAD